MSEDEIFPLWFTFAWSDLVSAICAFVGVHPVYCVTWLKKNSDNMIAILSKVIHLSRLLCFNEFAPRNRALTGTQLLFSQSRNPQQVWRPLASFFNLDPKLNQRTTLCSPCNFLAIDKWLFWYTVYSLFAFFQFYFICNHFILSKKSGWGKIFATKKQSFFMRSWEYHGNYFFLQQARIQTAAS